MIYIGLYIIGLYIITLYIQGVSGQVNGTSGSCRKSYLEQKNFN